MSFYHLVTLCKRMDSGFEKTCHVSIGPYNRTIGDLPFYRTLPEMLLMHKAMPSLLTALLLILTGANFIEEEAPLSVTSPRLILSSWHETESRNRNSSEPTERKEFVLSSETGKWARLISAARALHFGRTNEQYLRFQPANLSGSLSSLRTKVFIPEPPHTCITSPRSPPSFM